MNRATEMARQVRPLLLPGGHLIAVAGVLLAVRLGRPRFFALAAYAVIALLLFDLLVLVKGRTVVQRLRKGAAVAADWRVTVAFALIYLAWVALAGRGLAPYLLISLAYLHGLGVIVTRDHSAAKSLGLVAVLSTVLLYSQMLGVGYFASTNDPIRHLAFIARIRDAGTTQAIRTAIYSDFPVLHIGVTNVSVVTGLSPYVSGYMTLVPLFQTSLMFVFLFASRVTNARRYAASAALLVSANPYFVEYALKIHPQSLSFVFLTAFLYLLVRGRDTWRHVVVVTLVTVAWVLTHHFSLAMALTLTGGAVVVIYLADGVLFDRTSLDLNLNAGYYLVLGVMMMSYWAVITNTVALPISWVLYFSPAASGVPTTTSYISLVDSFGDLLVSAVPFFLDNIHFAFWLPVVGVGCWTLLSDRWRSKLALFALCIPGTVMYFPNPAWIPLQGVVSITRWGLVALPFVTVPLVLGLDWSARNSRETVVTGVVFLLVVTSVTSALADPSLIDMSGYQKESREQLSGAEVHSLSFVATHHQTAVYLPSKMRQYVLMERLKDNPNRRFKPRKPEPYRYLRSNDIPGSLMFEPGLTVFPETTFRESAIGVRVVAPGSEFYEDESTATISTSVSDQSVVADPTGNSRVYTNGGVDIYSRPGGSVRNAS